ncbi:Proclotting enzyme-like 11 [Homarus americanus]|uniref:Proclotting enzyme-like 11 n=1 Tax=Homarus americanus TaxID=6706 RepID=A0A8J5MK14_HOMAM|nr:Proclotting enzyme-like 11 [Homarus americanus]
MFSGPRDSQVRAKCTTFQVPRSKLCSGAALHVSAPGSATKRLCGRRSNVMIDRRSQSLTLTNHPQRHTSNLFTCDLYLVSPPNSRVKCKCGAENLQGSIRQLGGSWAAEGGDGDELPAQISKMGGVKIVGGKETRVGQYPWMGGLAWRNMKRVFCGVVVVTDRHVLTAAHCVDEYQRVDVGDLAVLTLDRPLPFGQLLQVSMSPVCLPERDSGSWSDHNATVMGWGTTDANSHQLPHKLQATVVHIMSNRECRTTTGYGIYINHKLLCAGLPQGGSDACLGDSGGPLTVQGEGGHHTLVGTVSFGRSCGVSRWPGVYTRTTAYVSWIMEHIKDGLRCDQ